MMAASDDPRVKFGLSCPIHGQFYICQDSTTRFIGCCGVDPCTPDLDGQCPTTELFNASFSAASGVMFLPQSCASPYDSSIWYTCDYSQPPFLGCCTNNPCNNGCLEGHLVLATLSEDPKNASQFMLPETTTTATPIGTATPSATGTSELPGGTETPGPNPVFNGRVRAGMIAGISVAGIVILLLVIAVYLWKKRRENDRQRCEQEETIRSNDLFQAPPPAEKTRFLAPISNGTSRDHPTTISSPSTSEDFRIPYLSVLSELEGNNGMDVALRPDLRDTGHGSERSELYAS